MESTVTLFMIAAVAIFIFGGMFYSRVAAKRRRAALEEVAAEMGLEWFPDGDSQLRAIHANFNLFNRGRARKIKNLIQGVTDEVQLRIFDYQFTVGSGKNQSTKQQTVAAMQSAQLNCPEFTMRPEGIFDRVGGLMGFQDIDFDSHPDFSKKFVLKGPNEEAIRKFFQPLVLEFFESQAGISVEGHNQKMCFYRAGKIVQPDQIKDLLGDAYQVFGSLVDA